MSELKKDSWRVVLFYLWLPSVEHSIQRVKERVEHGGHNIPEVDIRRRYPRSIANLLVSYSPICDETICLNNQSRNASLIFNQKGTDRSVVDQPTYDILVRSISNE